MKRYVIERAIPDIGSAEREELKGAAAQSNGVLSAMQSEGKGIQWEHSYVASDKTVCIYVADNEDLIAEHAEQTQEQKKQVEAAIDLVKKLGERGARPTQ